MASDTATPVESEPEKKGFKFPTAYTVLFFVLLLVFGLTLVIKPGTYQFVSCDGSSARPIPGSYQQVDIDKTFKERLYELWIAPVNGLYGIRELSQPYGDVYGEVTPAQQQAADEICAGETAEVVTAPGNTGPYNDGSLFGAAAVFFFVLSIGAFITVTIKTGALDAGIARLTHRFRTRANILIVVLMLTFSLGGTTYGMMEETLGFYALIVPIFVALGYDRLLGAVVIMVGAGTGTLASTVNPFATGVASDSAGIALGNGIGLRVLMYIVLTAVSVMFVLRYASKIKKDPSKRLVPLTAEDEALEAESEGEPPEMTGQQKVVIWIFMLTFALMIFSVVPWSDFFPSWERVTWGWFFPELAALFLVAAVIIGLVGKLGEEGMVGAIIAGMGDFIGAAFIIAFARGITVLMNNAGVTDTVLHSLETAVVGLSGAVFAVMVYIVNIPLAFLVPSSSGHAALAMPIMAPLGDFAGVSRSIVVTAYQSASGWVNLFTPTNAVVMGGLAIAKVRYDRYLKFVWPLLIILFVLTCVMLAIGVAIPALGGTT
jgi:uncharacterized ion transporter superfamily protein YfcC